MEVARAIGYEPPVLCSSCEHSIAIDRSPEIYNCRVKNTVSMQTVKCQYYSGPEQPVDVVIITATNVETDAVFRHLCPGGKDAWSSSRFRDDTTFWWIAELRSPCDERQRLRIAFAQTPFMGLPATAVQVMKGLKAFKPLYLVMLGITAGNEDETNLGDIIVPSVVFDYGAGKWNGRRFQPAPHQLEIDNEVLRNCEFIKLRCRDELNRIAAEWVEPPPGRVQLEIHCSDHHAVSGAAVINSAAIWKRILKIDKKVAAIDMEAYSVVLGGRHANRDGVKVLIAKSVCDYGIEKNDKTQPYAAYTSVRFFRLYAEKFLFPRFGEK